MKNASRLAAAAAALLVTLGAGGVSPAQAQSTTQANQGGAVYIEGSGYCTIGYNDPARQRSLVAAHCGEEGQRVRLVDHDARIGSQPVGTFYRSRAYDGRLGNDWAAIQWDLGVAIGGNSFSGDAWVHPGSLASGQQVCYFGQMSNRPRHDVTCGSFRGAVGNTFFVDAPMTHPGDSGGPIWVPGRGFVGVVSSTWNATPIPFLGARGFVMGVLPEDGPAVPEASLLALYIQNLLLPAVGSSNGVGADMLRGAFSHFVSLFSLLGVAIPGAINYT
ncbi:hypothetical protein [Corynebacterium sp. LK2510]|uniref:hypothetical protein n=1 Tax=Corynebacterium sp. LK2510 TaxID=3110472 RepID=UPI0034CED3D3